MKTQHHQIWIIHVINNTQEQPNLFHLLPSHHSEGLSVLPRCLRLHSNSLYFYAARSGGVTQVLIDTLINRPCTVLISLWFDSLFPPPEAHLACWHKLCIGITTLSFSADGWQSRPNAAEVVILNNSFWFMTTFPTESSDLPDCVVWTALCHSVDSPDTHSRNWQKNALN